MLASHMWELAAAQRLVKRLEPRARALDYHTLLAGSVLHRGWSDKDLDLWFIPLNGYPSRTMGIVKMLIDVLGEYQLMAPQDSPEYHQLPRYCTEMGKFTYLGKRIDVFIL